MRKATICGYADLIRTSDTVRNHRAFIKAANLATKIYLELEDRKINSDSIDGQNDDDAKKQESSEQRKQRRKQNKFKAVQQATEAAKKDEAKEALKYKIDGNAGENYLKAKDFLENAEAFMKPLLDLDVKNLEYYQRAFDFYRRKNKVKILSVYFNINDFKILGTNYG